MSSSTSMWLSSFNSCGQYAHLLIRSSGARALCVCVSVCLCFCASVCEEAAIPAGPVVYGRLPPQERLVARSFDTLARRAHNEGPLHMLKGLDRCLESRGVTS
eukprot:296255-Pyramimonas_sp.AAC.1